MPHSSDPLAVVTAVTSNHRHEACQGAEFAAGPGWFDSSWDLQRGLEVRESWSGDERVHGWIEDFLRTRRTLDRIAAASPTAAMA